MSVAVKWLAVQPSPPPSVDPNQAKGPSLDGHRRRIGPRCRALTRLRVFEEIGVVPHLTRYYLEAG